MNISQLELQRLAGERAEQESVVTALRVRDCRDRGKARGPGAADSLPGRSLWPRCASAGKRRLRLRPNGSRASRHWKSVTARPRPCSNASIPCSTKWASAFTPSTRKSAPPPPKKCSVKRKTCNCTASRRLRSRAQCRRRRVKACCSSKPNKSAHGSPKSKACFTTPVSNWTRPATAKASCRPAAAKLQADTQYMSETCLNELGVERERVADRRHAGHRLRRRARRRRSGPSRDAHPARGHGPGEHDGARGVQGKRRAPQLPRHPAQGSDLVH